MDGITIQDVVKSYGDYRANEAASTSVSNYEEKHGLKDGKPVNAGGSEEGKGKGGKKLTLLMSLMTISLPKWKKDGSLSSRRSMPMKPKEPNRNGKRK